MKKYLTLITFLISLQSYSCKENNTLPEHYEDGIFIYKCMDQDPNVLKDIKNVLEEYYQSVCDDLEYQYTYKVVVEIYPDQKTYNENVMDDDLIGYPACSGNRRMQLVSPASPIKVSGIPYNERLLMAVHEFVHLMINEINNELPMWLNEGLASYEGSSAIYEYFCKTYFYQLPSIELNHLERNYYSIPAADIYSYSAVHFIVEKFGFKKLNQLIRNPENFEKILSISKSDFNKQWNSFIDDHYRRNNLKNENITDQNEK